MDDSVSPPQLDREFWRDRRTLVTGATGLLGSAVVQQLLTVGADPVCLIRDWVPSSNLVVSSAIENCAVVRGDVRDGLLLDRALGEYEVSTVLHLAAQTIVGIAERNPTSTFETNVGGTWALLDSCRRSPLVESVVVASSDKAYGAQPVLPYTEDMPLIATNPYDVSKACADMIARSYASTWNINVGITRCGNFYGGGDLNWNRLIPGTIRSVLRGKRPVIRSDGSPVRDYIHVDDGATANLLLAQRLATDSEWRAHAFNFSTDTPLSAGQVVDRILEKMDSDLEPDIRNEPFSEIQEQYLDSTKAREVLGWRPVCDFDAGLGRTIAWYRAFLAERSPHD